MTSTIVGTFDDGARARAATSELAQIGVNPSDITIAQSDAQTGYKTYQGGSDESREVGGGIGGFFKRLFGSDVGDDDTGLYSEAVRRGSTVVTADVDDSVLDAATDVLERNGAVDIDRLANQYRASGYSTFDESAPIFTPEQSRSDWDGLRSEQDTLRSEQNTSLRSEQNTSLPVIEEELQVGKRTVRRGGVRVYSRTTERPVDETITLREEHVRVERRPASRDVTSQDLDVMQDRTIEVTESAEEAVVAKRARVVEEVVVSKDVDEHEEHVHDTVRRTDVEVEDLNSEGQLRTPVRAAKGRRDTL